MERSIEKLAELFREFPGIGERQAKRFVYFLLRKNDGYINELVEEVKKIKKNTKQCKNCFRYFEENNKDSCNICADLKRDKGLIMVVEKDVDTTSFERSKTYNGCYFVFGGTVPVVEKKTPAFVRIEELKKRAKEELASSALKEIILAFSLTPAGEHTDLYVRSELGKIIGESGVKISSLGRGLSTGTELEYSDKETLKNAFQNRH